MTSFGDRIKHLRDKILGRWCLVRVAIKRTLFFRYPKKVNYSPIAPMVALPDNILMSAEEYLLWEPTQEQRYEYWDGEVVAMSGGTRNHNRISLNFSKFLNDALTDRACEV